MVAVSTVIVLALVMTILLSDLHPVARAAGRTSLVKRARDKRLGTGVVLHRSSSRLMQSSRAAICAGGLDLLQDVGATLRFDLIGRLPD
jgi:hypothetical protein